MLCYAYVEKMRENRKLHASSVFLQQLRQSGETHHHLQEVFTKWNQGKGAIKYLLPAGK